MTHSRRTPDRGRFAWLTLKVGLVAAILVALLVAASVLDETSPGSGRGSSGVAPTSSPSDIPGNSPDLPVSLPDLGDALLVVGHSAPYDRQRDRTTNAPASLVVWTSGLVVGNAAPALAPPDYRVIQLSAVELDELRAALLAAELATMSRPNQESGARSCADCGVVIARTDVSGATVEVALYGWAITGMPSSYVDSLPVSDGVKEVGRRIEDLLVAVRGSRMTTDPDAVPTIPIAGPPAGG